MALPSLAEPTRGASETVFGVWGGLGKKMANAWLSVGREDYLRAAEFASPAFVENVLKAIRMTTMGATTPAGKMLFDEHGWPIKETAGEAVFQTMGFRPERIAAMAAEHRGFVNVESKFTGMRNDLYARFRLAKTPQERMDVVRDMQRYNLEAMKFHGAIPMINAGGLLGFMKSGMMPEKKFMEWGNQFGAEA